MAILLPRNEYRFGQGFRVFSRSTSGGTFEYLANRYTLYYKMTRTRRAISRVGAYQSFTLYVPERQQNLETV
jgi:hypothetical protein